ncbi:NADP-dependent D-sorbitol-6-phosphate dehydrogenase-like [Lolium rigidum]|uniref:NADP-dependent D-sorbitol-6-phosphate dehydrogenase-like n=1 Tax=Lolium rigidum TaxID=89674 RepID=UPI001F5D02FD|nr:NADP-dependent D-sorbitol-6-phosphate dehydrogenase-like [Lolium rigidum]
MAATTLALSSGHQMPAVGLGVWRMDSSALRGLIHSALRAGYRHFDCAGTHPRARPPPTPVQSLPPHIESNPRDSSPRRRGSMLCCGAAEVVEAAARFALRGGVELWNSDHGHVVEACKDSLKKLRLDYLDLYLIHFPVATKHTGVGITPSVLGDDGVLDIDATISLETTWHVMEDLVSMGLVRSIGISNYDIFLTRDCLAYAKIKPAVNQIETHPYFQRDSLVKFCQKHGICVTAHTPLSGSTANTERFGSVSCLDDPVIKSLAEKYGKTPVQLVLRWGLQRTTVVIPKTSKVERLDENLAVFDFDISGEDMDKIKALDRNYRTNNPAKFWGIDLYA